MKPYTIEDAETELRIAIDSGDVERIDAAAERVDRLEETKPPVTLHAAALWYASQGLRVFPLTPGTKIPFKGTRGCKDATSDPEAIARWWTGEPEANIGLATGHLVDVVDIDGAIGQESRARHWGMFAALTVIGTVSTPRPGGMHLIVPASGQGNKAGLLPGVDYRGVGGYVVAAPSRTDVGTYRFISPLTLSPAVQAVA